jgi:hypothetical protein
MTGFFVNHQKLTVIGELNTVNKHKFSIIDILRKILFWWFLIILKNIKFSKNNITFSQRSVIW